ncbi:hypothetical protein EST38_g343 [Candolleomyces aberdarensis]|uniref:Uncharacterized protein n=1 Tax=Candolleomyces aberdarensis TaxID=2316362 RepID=A0A4Q2E1B7_9AGAR|nr:hypothetical protein EST38_g343 [Candolleomyces aberdarensis]
MISSTTLILATLVFNAASVLGAPIRIPTAPEVAVRAAVDDPILPRVEIVDVQPEHKRSVDGTSSRPRLAREIAPEHTPREPASPESVEMRDSLPEVEEIVRRFPRRSLFEFYQKRSSEPSPAPSDPAAQLETRSAPAEPELSRRYPRRVYHDYYAKRAEPTPPEARSEAPAPDAPQLQRRYPRRVLAEYYEKRSAPPTDHVLPREPSPEPAPEPVPEAAPEPAPVKPQEQERHAREVEAPTEYLEKRQEESEGSPTTTEAPPAGETTTTSSPSPTATLPGTPLPTGGATTTSTSTTSVPTPPTSGVPQTLDFNRVIADAIVKGNSNTVHEGPNGKTNSYKDTTIMIKITQQENSDRKLDPVPSSSNAAPTPTSTDTKGSASKGGATPTSTSSTSSTASATATPPPSTETPPPSGSTGDDSTTKPADTGASTPPPDGGEGAAQESRRDLGEDNAAAQPIKKRTLGLSGALWATWSRRNAMN